MGRTRAAPPPRRRVVVSLAFGVLATAAPMAWGWRLADDRRPGAAPLNSGPAAALGSFIHPNGADVWTWGVWEKPFITSCWAAGRDPLIVPGQRLTVQQRKRSWEINRHPDGWPPSSSGVTADLLAQHPHTVAEGYAVGFPFRCGRAVILRAAPGGDPADHVAAHGYDMGMAAYTEHLGRVVPTSVIWPGMLGNIAAYTLLLLAPWHAAAWWRTRRAARLNRCPACGYDLRATPANAPCPECGGTRVVSAGL
ncbi:MAG TPA: hypothetical protein VD997_08600 [Phycisphaerales bacterium]|nr:hypothetical protein [Phycisphaerales bacterium]